MVYCRKRRLEKSLGLLIFLFINSSTLFAYFSIKLSNKLSWEYFISKSNFESANIVVPDMESVAAPLILLWNGFYMEPPTLKGWKIGDGKWAYECSHTCTFTADKNLSAMASAIIFFGSETLDRYERPRGRSPNQIYIFHYKEPPISTHLDLHNYRNFFNWTASYHRRSDLWNPYGEFYEKGSKSQIGYKYKYPYESIDETIRYKKKLMVWIVSDCSTTSNREGFVQELIKYIDIDIIGWCGKNPSEFNCTKTSFRCARTVGKDYKFYLSLENSLCEDYVTEKLFRPYGFGMVPIVYGYPGVYKKFAPPGSYIDVMDFKGAQDLAEYVKFLDSNEEAYRKYFEWRNTYEVAYHTWQGFFCPICERLYNNTQRQTYVNIHRWWNYKENGDRACLKIKDVGLQFYDLKLFYRSI